MWPTQRRLAIAFLRPSRGWTCGERGWKVEENGTRHCGGEDEWLDGWVCDDCLLWLRMLEVGGRRKSLDRV